MSMRRWLQLLVMVPGLLAPIACGTASSLDRIANKRSKYGTLPRPSPLPAGLIESSNLRLLDGSSASLQNVLGQGKVVVVNFWATWCGPCRKEVPQLNALNREFRDRSVEIFGLSVEDSQEAANLVRMFADQYEIKYRLGFASDEMFYKFSGSDPNPVIPQTFVFDKNGTLTLHLPGFHPEFAEILRETIEKSL